MKIVNLNTKQDEFDSACRETLETFLKFVGEGTIDSLAIVCTQKNGSVSHQYCLGSDGFALLGAVESLKQRIYHENDL